MVICRLCLYEIDVEYGIYNLFTPLTQPLVMEETLALSVMKCVPINIVLNDGLPETICSNCYDDLTSAYKFRQLCVNSNQSLRTQPQQEYSQQESCVEKKESLMSVDSKSKPTPDCKAGDAGKPDDELYKLNNLDKLSCNICAKKFKHHGRFVLHMQKHNAPQKVYDCRKCNKNFKSSEALKTHKIQCHALNTTFNLSGSKKNTAIESLKKKKPDTNVQTVKRKRAKNASVNPTNLQCKICFKTFKRINSLIKHKEKHSLYNFYLKTRLNKKKTLTIHKESSNNQKLFECKACNSNFRSQRQLNRHMANSHGEGMGKKRAIAKSGKNKSENFKSFNANNAGDAKRNVPSGDKQINQKCTFCDEIFTSFASLKQHTRMHLQAPLHPCHKCKKEFGSLKNLNEHLRTHLLDWWNKK